VSFGPTGVARVRHQSMCFTCRWVCSSFSSQSGSQCVCCWGLLGLLSCVRVSCGASSPDPDDVQTSATRRTLPSPDVTDAGWEGGVGQEAG
jgi:hypothetical protein